MARISLLISLLLSLASSFTTIPSRFTTTPTSQTTLEMGFGDAFKGAFSNDDKLGKVQNAGLKNGPDYNDKVTINGKAVKAVTGQKVAIVANAARVRIKYDCQAGDCGTCMIKMNGRKVKACQSNIPRGKCAIETL
mmetsp:Transcript_2309/g.2992  ORF Transcript_2309/g.2992 Transcript_2309/m.2992 type:complete len:136 (-) Transcript_2309:64-471(-)|eukprot:CAMPEP_0172497978 /NCGR_PEP_ID=MMETSP1066-20121228/107710_1 /TAXON_ID=671091 /ORGANISM="Coscinodiscus wailesii, Strain CCMP2513" /LENGTH=135 /DNA_ID=CAMNT_0013271039 /DNA_START=93 /DNA_END=500 /DNA_ORIENTATION=+